MTPHVAGACAAAVDIGSNSIKMTVGRPDGHGGIVQIAWASEVVRLGEGVAESGQLDARRIEAAVEALARFAAQARELGAQRIVAVATEATRAAANGAGFLERVRNETGIDVRVIDGDEEAALTFRGLATETDLSGSVVIADIGGGSTELIQAVDGAMAAATSLRLGSGRLTEWLVHTDPPTSSGLAACEAEASRLLEEAAPELAATSGPGRRLVLVGGTPEYMARLLPEGQPVNVSGVRSVLAALVEMTAAELAERIAVPEARARVLPAGVAIVAAITEQITPETIEIAHSGVRAGLLLEAFRDNDRSGKRRRKPKSRVGDTDQKNHSSLDERANDGEGPPDADFRETMKALIGERWAAVWAAVPVALSGEDIEGVHDVRVASRRLRAAMDIAAPAFPSRWYTRLHRTAKAITGALGEVRDRDVLLEELRADRTNAPAVEHPGLDRLIDRIERERIDARVEMEAFLSDLLEGSVRGEVQRRFGQAIEPPNVPTASRERPA